MVTINKQSGANSKPIGVPKAPPGSVLASAIPVSELADDYIKMVIYGENRCGKTTLACQFPKPLLLIAFEPNKTGGAKSVKKVPGVTYIKIETSEKALRLAQELKNDRTFKTHVLDTATSYQDIFLRELMGLDEVPEQLNWGTVSQDVYRQRSEKTREGLRPFLNLPAHTVVLAKQRDHNPNREERNKIVRGMQAESYFASDLGGATVGWLHDACDYIARLYLEKEVIAKTLDVNGDKLETVEETGRVVRRLRTMMHPNYAAGFRSENPDAVPEFIEAPDFAKILKVIEGKWRVGVDK